MNRTRIVAAAIAMVAIAGPAPAQSVYRCTGPEGSVIFQDRPCSGSAEQRTVTLEKQPRTKLDGYEGRVVPLPGGSEAAIMVHDYVDMSVSEDGERTTTVRLRSKPGAPARVSMSLTFMPNKNGEMLSREQRERAVRRIATNQAGRSFADYQMVEFDARLGKGLVTVLDNRQPRLGAAPPGEYPIMTAGLITNDDFVVALTVLTDGDDDRVLRDAITVAKTMFIASKIYDTSGGAGELALPDPPSGYSWQRAPRIKGAILKPDGWYFDTKHEGDDQAYFVSREPHVEPDGYDTGFSLNVQTNVPAKTGMSAATYAAEFIRTAQDELETLEPPFVEKSGPFVMHGAVLGATDPEKGDFNALMVAIANDITGTVFVCIFEAPADEWETLWPVGDTILQKLLINDAI